MSFCKTGLDKGLHMKGWATSLCSVQKDGEGGFNKKMVYLVDEK